MLSYKMLRFLFLILFFILFNTTNVFAQNILNGIEIDSNSGGHQIILNTKESVQVIKNIQDSNVLHLDIKDIIASNTLSTVFNNALDITNVIVKPLSKNSLRITIEGENISKAGIVINPLVIQDNTLTLNKPISEYSNLFQDAKNTLLQKNDSLSYYFGFISNKLNSFGISLVNFKNFIRSFSSSFNFDIFTYIGLFILVIVVGNKILNSKEEEISVGLSQSLKSNSSGNHLHSLNNLNLDSKNRDILKNRSRSKLLDTDIDSSKRLLNANVGLNAYKMSQKNPYMTASIQKNNPDLTQNNLDSINYNQKNLNNQQVTNRQRDHFNSKAAQKNKMPFLNEQKSSFLSNNKVISENKNFKDNSYISSSITPQQHNMQSDIQNNRKKQFNLPLENRQLNAADKKNNVSSSKTIDTVKFLESMSKIYEKNGRVDLANELKSNLKRAKAFQK